MAVRSRQDDAREKLAEALDKGEAVNVIGSLVAAAGVLALAIGSSAAAPVMVMVGAVCLIGGGTSFGIGCRMLYKAEHSEAAAAKVAGLEKSTDPQTFPRGNPRPGFQTIENAWIDCITDFQDRADPLAGWRLDPSRADCDVKGIYADKSETVYVDSNQFGLLPKRDYEEKVGMRFRVNGALKP
jgi:hypothetical protein